MIQNIKKFFRENYCATMLAILAVVFFLLKFIVPLTAPILLAMLFVTALGPFLQKVQNKLHLPRQISAVIILIIMSCVLVFLGWILSLGIGEKVQNVPKLLKELDQRGIKVIGIFNRAIQDILPKLLAQVQAYAKNMAIFFVFIVFFVIAVVLLAKDYDNLMTCLLEKEDCRLLLEVICGVINYLATYVKAQLVIMTVIGTWSACVLGISGVPQGVFAGLLAGVLDALPLIGTGVVLVPLGVMQFLSGEYGRAVVCVVLYVSCIFLRQWLEPKLIGKKVGISPVLVLLSLYVGIQLFGTWGIVKGPLGLIMVWQIYEGIVFAENK